MDRRQGLRKLWLEFDDREGGRPVRARVQAPARGPWLRVTVEEEALAAGQVFLLHRVGMGDLVVGASARPDSLETARSKLGLAAYVICSVPIVK